MRIGMPDAVDLLFLAGAERLLGVETPNAIQEPLPAQNLVDAGNAAGETIGGVEDRRVGVGNLHMPLQHAGRNVGAVGSQSAAFVQKLDGPARPNGPVP